MGKNKKAAVKHNQNLLRSLPNYNIGGLCKTLVSSRTGVRRSPSTALKRRLLRAARNDSSGFRGFAKASIDIIVIENTDQMSANKSPNF